MMVTSEVSGTNLGIYLYTVYIQFLQELFKNIEIEWLRLVDQRRKTEVVKLLVGTKSDLTCWRKVVYKTTKVSRLS